MKRSGVFSAIAVALTVAFYLLTYFFLPPPPSPALMVLFAAIALALVWMVDAGLRWRRKRTRVKDSGRAVRSLVVWTALASSAVVPRGVHAQAAAPLTVKCTAKPLYVLPGHSTTVITLAHSNSNRPLTYRYSASDGSIWGVGRSAVLSTVDASSGRITVSCSVIDDLGNHATATITVYVLPPPEPPAGLPTQLAPEPTSSAPAATPPSAAPEAPLPAGAPPPPSSPPAPPPLQGGAPSGPRLTGTALLSQNSSEAAGYGLYSYVLLSHAPAHYEQERYRSLFVALLSGPSAEDLGRFVPKSRINITYLLTRVAVPPASRSSAEAEADFLLKNYDYARGAALLSSLPGHTGSGPVIVSVLEPFHYGEQPHPVLVQDLSTAQPDLMSLYVRAFCEQVAQEQFWQPQRLAAFSLSLRNVLETTAAGLGMSRTAVASWVKVSK